MIWRKHLDGVLNVLIYNVNILSEKATNYLLGFLNVASQAFFDNILALRIRTLGTPSKCYFHIIITCFLMQIFGDLKNKCIKSKELDTLKFIFKIILNCFKLKFGYLKFSLNNEY